MDIFSAHALLSIPGGEGQFPRELSRHGQDPQSQVPLPTSPCGHLVVDISPVIDQQLQTECAIGGDGSHVQWREALVIRLVDIGACIHQLNGHGILAKVAGDVQSCVSKSVGLIDLDFQEGKGSRV